jgi:hypothetical protein
MNWKSTATIGVSGGTLVALLATAAPSIDRRHDTLPPAASIDTKQGAALVAQTARLLGPLSPQIPPSKSTRNPFAFAHSAAVSASTPSGPAEPIGGSAPDPIRLPPPPFTLVGLAEDRASGATVMTAILSSPGALQFVKQGDRVTGGYRVTTISAESVELLDADGRSLLLRLP